MLASLRLTFGPDGIVAHGDAELEVDHGVALVVDAPRNLTHLLPSVTEPLEYFSALKILSVCSLYISLGYVSYNFF